MIFCIFHFSLFSLNKAFEIRLVLPFHVSSLIIVISAFTFAWCQLSSLHSTQLQCASHIFHKLCTTILASITKVFFDFNKFLLNNFFKHVLRYVEKMLVCFARKNCFNTSMHESEIVCNYSLSLDVEGAEFITFCFSVNKIANLEAFSSCHNLKELYLRRNEIKSVDELSNLADLKQLK